MQKQQLGPGTWDSHICVSVSLHLAGQGLQGAGQYEGNGW